jgi:hypothetical protein
VTIFREIEAAVGEWLADPIPRPPMPAKCVLLFHYDWPVLPWLRPRCGACGRRIRPGELLMHAYADHPGWTEKWNSILRSGGIVR